MQEALDQVALSQQIAPLPGRHVRVIPDGFQQQCLQLLHPGDLPPGEHPPHQHQQGCGVLHQHPVTAAVQQLQHLLGPQGRQQNARIPLDHVQGRVPPAAFAEGGQGLQIVPPVRIPAAIPGPVFRLLLRGQGVKIPLGAGLHHVVEPVSPAGEPGDKGVFRRQVRQDLRCVRLAGNIPGHVPGELVGLTHNRQEPLPPGRQGPQHGGGEHLINVRFSGVRSLLRQGPEPQVNGGHPALRGLLQLCQLLLVQGRAAAVDIGRQLAALQPQLLRADAVQPSAQPQHLIPGQDPVPAGGDEVDVFRQSRRQFA